MIQFCYQVVQSFDKKQLFFILFSDGAMDVKLASLAIEFDLHHLLNSTRVNEVAKAISQAAVM